MNMLTSLAAVVAILVAVAIGTATARQIDRSAASIIGVSASK